VKLPVVLLFEEEEEEAVPLVVLLFDPPTSDVVFGAPEKMTTGDVGESIIPMGTGAKKEALKGGRKRRGMEGEKEREKRRKKTPSTCVACRTRIISSTYAKTGSRIALSVVATC
jgi:hypothetical protein